MTNVIPAKTASYSLSTHSKTSGRGCLMGIWSRSWSAYRALHPPRGLSARFGFRLAPTKLHQKSTCHAPNRAGRDLVSPPPFRNVPVLHVDQSRQRPRIPERRGDHFSPNLHLPLGFILLNCPAVNRSSCFKKRILRFPRFCRHLTW